MSYLSPFFSIFLWIQLAHLHDNGQMMGKKNRNLLAETTAAFFEGKEVRRERYNDERWFSVVDIVNILSNSQSKDK